MLLTFSSAVSTLSTSPPSTRAPVNLSKNPIFTLDDFVAISAAIMQIPVETK